MIKVIRHRCNLVKTFRCQQAAVILLILLYLVTLGLCLLGSLSVPSVTFCTKAPNLQRWFGRVQRAIGSMFSRELVIISCFVHHF